MQGSQGSMMMGLPEMLNDSSIDRIMAIDMNWQIIAWNKTSELVSGTLKTDVLGKKLLSVFPQFTLDKEMMRAIDLALSGIKSFLPAQKGQFNRHYYENHFIPLQDDEGVMVGVMNIMHDVSHRIKAEQELLALNIALSKKYEELARATDELSTVTYITSHNIKEPLRQLYSSLELLVRAEAKLLSDGGKANLRRMQASLNRMNLLLDDILALSGVQHPGADAVPVDLNEVLAEIKKNLAEKINASNVQLSSVVLPVVKGHRELLYYLFYHLTVNAIRSGKHHEALSLSISSELADLSGGDALPSFSTAYIKVSFSDNGMGFGEDDAERIFSMADKSPHKYAGSGAGLAICRKIMIIHEGFIQAEGRPGEGAAFHCYFPAS